jgi:ankyrin repeat protein
MADIHDAIRAGKLNRVRAFLNQGVSVNSREHGSGWTPLHFAAHYGRLNIVRELLRRGARLNARSNSIGFTPLHWAAYQGHPRVVHALIQAGANTNNKNKYGTTPYNASHLNSSRNALRTSAAVTKWLNFKKKQQAKRAETMLLSPTLLGRTPLPNNMIRLIAARGISAKRRHI